MNTRLLEVSNWLEKEDIDFAFINSVPNIYYLSGYVSDPIERLLALLVFKDKTIEPVLICPALEEMEVKRSSWEFSVISYTDNENLWEKIKHYFDRNNVMDCKAFAIEQQFLSYIRYESIQMMFPTAMVKSIDQKMNDLRVIKDELEVEYMKEAAKLAELSISLGLEVIKEGCTEIEVSTHIEHEQMKRGIQRKTTRPLVLFGHNSSLPHGSSGDRKLKKGDFILIDLGVKYKEYCSDMTRTFFFQSANEEVEKIYNTVLEANLAAIEECKIGTRIGDLDQIARKIIEDAGYGDYFPHRIGHGLGIEGHEYPSMSGNNNDVLKEGMTFTIEPGIYIPQLGGVRIEDEVHITKEGPELFTSLSKDFQIIE